MSATTGIAGKIYATEIIDVVSKKRLKVSDLVNGGASGEVKAEDITDATETGVSLLKAEDADSARELIGASNLQIGTTGTTAMAGNRTPTATIRGGVIQQAAIADLTADPTQADFNALLAALRSAGVLAS